MAEPTDPDRPDDPPAADPHVWQRRHRPDPPTAPTADTGPSGAVVWKALGTFAGLALAVAGVVSGLNNRDADDAPPPPAVQNQQAAKALRDLLDRRQRRPADVLAEIDTQMTKIEKALAPLQAITQREGKPLSGERGAELAATVKERFDQWEKLLAELDPDKLTADEQTSRELLLGRIAELRCAAAGVFGSDE